MRTNEEQFARSEPVSPGGRSEQVGSLRDAIARIEGGGGARLDGSGTTRRVALGAGYELALDRLLRGGLLRGTLHEVVAAAPGDAGAACGFALALAARFAAECFASHAREKILWVVEDGARTESGAPYAPGLFAHGIDPDRLVVVRTASGADTLWAMEEALKCRTLAAVVADLWRTKPYDLVASRRLVLAGQKSKVPGILVPAGAAGTADALSSAARLRFEVAARPSAHAAGPPFTHQNPALPGSAAWAVRLARIRAGPDGHAETFDPEKIWPLVWDHEEARFRDALPLPASALPRDRPHPATRMSPLPLAAGRDWGAARAS